MHSVFQSDFESEAYRELADRDQFESFVSSQENELFLARQLSLKQADFDRFETESAACIERRDTLLAQQLTHQIAVGTLSGRVARQRDTLTRLHEEQTRLQQARAAAKPDYSLVGGLFFLVAGLSFLFGDLVISHEIVAYALNIRDTTEAWAFALALAMITVLLKPVYDRLLERPYQTDPVRFQVRYQRFKLALASFALLTLTVLGWFRYEAYRTDQLKSAINRTVRQLQQNGTPLDGTTAPPDAALLARIEQQLQQAGELNLALVSSPWAMLSFVFSGLLFALAGAVCLGIGLPVVSAFWLRWLQIDRRLWVLRRRETKLTALLQPDEEALATHLIQQRATEQRLGNVPDPTERNRQRATLLAELTSLGNDHRLAVTDRRIAAYQPATPQAAQPANPWPENLSPPRQQESLRDFVRTNAK